MWFESSTDEYVSLIQKIMSYEFELGNNAAEATKNICCAKGEKTVDLIPVE